LNFFGLRPKDKLSLHSNIFSLIYHGNGGFTFSDIYDMPVYLRNFYFRKLIEIKDTEKEQLEKAKNPNKKQNRPQSRFPLNQSK